MPFPKTLDELRAANYIFDNYGECRGCGEDIDWYLTPRGKKLPFNHMDKGTDPAIAHFSTCPEADSFRKRD
jgi:hypothetical protein